MQLTLKQARKRRRLTFAKLAAKSGIHKATVARIERGENRPTYDTVVALEVALNLKPGTLVFKQAEHTEAAAS
jgi:transcriptional regulator with XRE-family HTH domain